MPDKDPNRIPDFAAIGTIEVRPCRSEDAEAVALVEASATATLRKTYRPNKMALANKRRISRDLERLVALLDGRVVGTTQYLVDGESIRIIGLGVLAGFRRAGVARALVDSLADLASTLGLKGLVARTVRETGNVAVFERLGFRAVSEGPDEYSESDVYPELSDVELRWLREG